MVFDRGWKSIAYTTQERDRRYPLGRPPDFRLGRSCVHRRARLAHRFAGDLQLDAMTLVNEAIQDGIGQGGLAEIGMPGIDG